MTIKSNMPEIESALVQFAGDADAMVDDALRHMAERITNHIQSNWPVASGASKAGWETQEVGHLAYATVNTQDYAEFVHTHPNQGGPEPLVDRLIGEIQDQVDTEFQITITDVFERALRGSR